MTPDEFREQGKRVVDRIADYMERVGEFPVTPDVEPGEVASMLPDAPPERAEPWNEILADVDRVVLPGITHWQSPSFFGYFPANASGPAILGDMLSSGLGVQGMLWSTSPACTEIETKVLDWLAGMTGLLERFTARSGTGGGVIQGTASEAVLVAMVAARRRAGDADGPLVAYCSSQAHSSVTKAAMIAGIGRENVRAIEVDAGLRMRAGALEDAIAADLAAGRTPFFVCATVGTTSSGAVDPLEEIGPVARQRSLWLHVDAAWAGSALVCDEHRWMIRGLEHADTFNFNPHKWLLTNFDCSALWAADRRALTDALSITPEYLRNRASETGEVIDYRDWQVPLGRRFRALKLWFVIRAYGARGLRAHVREGVRQGEVFESLVRADDRFELAAERSLSLVCFRLKGDDEVNRALLERLNATRKVFLTHTTLPDPKRPGASRYVLRMAMGGANTTEAHVRAAWDLIRSLAGDAEG